MTERRSDGVSGNGGSGGNIGGRFGRDRMRFGLNGKEMEWNMVHDKITDVGWFLHRSVKKFMEVCETDRLNSLFEGI